jgi:hypothetical protein
MAVSVVSVLQPRTWQQQTISQSAAGKRGGKRRGCKSERLLLPGAPDPSAVGNR